MLDPALHEQHTTNSRQLRSAADFLHAVRWAVAQGLHPRATSTTVTVAEMLAAKINRHGHMAYARERLAAAMNVSLSTVRNHTRILRELGLLTWVEHGTRRNVLRTKNPSARPAGYKATATIFAAVAPPYWDRAMGRTTAGHGYTARLVSVDDLGRAYEAALSREAQATRTGPTADDRRCPPSVSGFSSSEKFGQKGGNNYTRTRARKIAPEGRPERAWRPVTPSVLARLVTATDEIKSQIPWLAGVCSRRLAFQLRERLLRTTLLSPLITELQALATPRRIMRPLAFLATQLREAPDEVHRFDGPHGWVQTAAAVRAPMQLPRYEESPEPTPDFAGDPAGWARWDAYCAERAFAAAAERWRDLDQHRTKADGLVPVYPIIDIPVDDSGARWAAVIQEREHAHAGAYERSALLRAELRQAWAAQRQSR